MSIPVATTYLSYTWTAQQVNPSIPYDFKITDDDHVRVTYISAAGNKATFVKNVDYVVSNVGNPAGGNINIIGTAYVGDKIVVDLYNVPITQAVTYTYAGVWPSSAIESAFDRVTNICKKLISMFDRALSLPVEDLGDNAEFPIKSARPNTVVGFDAVGNLTLMDSSSLSAGAGITSGSKQYSVGTGATVAMGTLSMNASDTTIRLEIFGSAKGKGSLAYWEGFITHKTGEAALIVSKIDELQAGKTGAQGVSFILTPGANSVALQIDGSALTGGPILVDTKIVMTSIVALGDSSYVFA